MGSHRPADAAYQRFRHHLARPAQLQKDQPRPAHHFQPGDAIERDRPPAGFRLLQAVDQPTQLFIQVYIQCHFYPSSLFNHAARSSWAASRTTRPGHRFTGQLLRNDSSDQNGHSRSIAQMFYFCHPLCPCERMSPIETAEIML